MKKVKGKKGFTLIEIIVVLVILAILAAAGIPTLLGFIGDARARAYTAEARIGVQAAQAVMTEFMMSDPTVSPNAFLDGAVNNLTSFNTTGAGVTPRERFNALVDPDSEAVNFRVAFASDGALTRIVYRPDGTTPAAASTNVTNDSIAIFIDLQTGSSAQVLRGTQIVGYWPAMPN